MYYQRNKQRAKYRSAKPTMTDQSQAADTDVNIIMGKFGIGGNVTVMGKQPIYGDFSEIPNDLASMIRMARTTAELRKKLPPQLQQMPDEHLFRLTNEQITAILTPPAPTPETPPAKPPA